MFRLLYSHVRLPEGADGGETHNGLREVCVQRRQGDAGQPLQLTGCVPVVVLESNQQAQIQRSRGDKVCFMLQLSQNPSSLTMQAASLEQDRDNVKGMKPVMS